MRVFANKFLLAVLSLSMMSPCLAAEEAAVPGANPPQGENAAKPTETTAAPSPEEAIQKAKQEVARKRFGDAKLVLKQSLDRKSVV